MPKHQHYAVIDLGYGDSGKGALVDRLCERHDIQAVVRFNGGCQAAHNVINKGRHHTFSQFGSGTFHGVPTLLTNHVMFEPLAAMLEAQHLRDLGVADPESMLFVQAEAKLTTPYHWFVNRWEETQRGDGRHGSCGRGIGTTMAYAEQIADEEMVPTAYDVLEAGEESALRLKLRALDSWARGKMGPTAALPDLNWLMNEYAKARKLFTWVGSSSLVLEEFMAKGSVVFEGAQGVLLDEHVGFHPHTTWSTCTPDNIITELNDLRMPFNRVTFYGVVRAYTTRHGAGPFIAEDASLNLPEAHNGTDEWQGSWRVGHLDLPALQYAVFACDNRIDEIYVTHVDSADAEPALKVCTSYDGPNRTFRLRQYDRHSFWEREAQTAALLSGDVQPSLEPWPADVTGLDRATYIADMLGLPLAGWGYGPSTEDGTWMDEETS